VKNDADNIESIGVKKLNVIKNKYSPKKKKKIQKKNKIYEVDLEVIKVKWNL
jgi:hypothetical protein